MCLEVIGDLCLHESNRLVDFIGPKDEDGLVNLSGHLLQKGAIDGPFIFPNLENETVGVGHGTDRLEKHS